MIEVQTTTALLLYLTLFLGICFGAWMFFHLKNRNKEILPPLYSLSTCEYCHYNYLSRHGEKLSKCPQCDSFNKAE